MYIGIIVWAIHINPEGDSPAPDPTWILVVVGVWDLLIIVATILAIVDAVSNVRARKSRSLGARAMVVKLVAIPFFVLNYVVLVFFFSFGLVSFVFGIGVVVWIFVGIGGGLTYLTMLSTNVYVWAAITQLRRERTIGVGLTVLYVILSLVFVTDIAAAVLLFGHSRRRPRLALVWLLVGAGIAIVLLGVVEYFYPIIAEVFPELGLIEFNDKLDWLLWAIPVAAGLVVILPTVIVSLARRSTLRLEAERAAAIQRPLESDASGLEAAS
jgi:hypothetical protein